MLVYSTDWYGKKTFRMLPTDAKCPFNEVIYDPGTKVLAIISKEHKEKPQMFPKLDEKGELVQKKGATGADGKALHVETREMMDTYYEYYIDTAFETAATISGVRPGASAESTVVSVS